MEGVNEKQVGGNHYVSMKVQPWDAMQACMTAEEFRGFLRGNVIRYAMRLGRKDSDDLGKLIHYAEKLRSLDEKAEPAPAEWVPKGMCPCDACKLIRRERAARLAIKQPADSGAKDSASASGPATP